MGECNREHWRSRSEADHRRPFKGMAYEGFARIFELKPLGGKVLRFTHGIRNVDTCVDRDAGIDEAMNRLPVSIITLTLDRKSVV